jgi:hypothetical protein
MFMLSRWQRAVRVGGGRRDVSVARQASADIDVNEQICPLVSLV